MSPLRSVNHSVYMSMFLPVARRNTWNGVGGGEEIHKFWTRMISNKNPQVLDKNDFKQKSTSFGQE